MFMTPKCWWKWINFFTQIGYECMAPPWPLHEAEPEQLRAYVPEGMGDLTLAEVLAEMEKTVRTCAEPPIVIGHSVGGLIAQVLVNKGLVEAGVAMSSVAPNAMLSFEWTFLRSTAPILNPLTGNTVQEITPERFHQMFANVLDEEKARLEWENYAVHESRNVLRTSLGEAGHVDLTRGHVPLLLVSGLEDKIVPPSLVKKNFDAYDGSGGARSMRLFPGHGHHICNEPEWEKVASYVDDWLNAHGVGNRSGHQLEEAA